MLRRELAGAGVGWLFPSKKGAGSELRGVPQPLASSTKTEKTHFLKIRAEDPRSILVLMETRTRKMVHQEETEAS